MSVAKPSAEWEASLEILRNKLATLGLAPNARELLESGKIRRILIACSGGADSVFLLCALTALKTQYGLTLTVGHYDHDWRGATSQQDALFVQTLAEDLALPFCAEKRAPDQPAFTETTAREARLEFLRRVAEGENCDAIAFGHQLDDIVETQLQRLARGVGCEGLAAPRPVAKFSVGPSHIRPFLHLRSADIRRALRSLRINWREDASNIDESIPRNALRHSIIPDLTNALGRDVSQGAARSRRLLEEDAVALEQVTQATLPQAFRSSVSSLDRKALRSVPTAILRRGLTAWLGNAGLIDSVGSRALDRLISAIQGEARRFRLSAGSKFVVMDAECVRTEADRSKTTSGMAIPTTVISAGERKQLPGAGTLEVERVGLSSDRLKTILEGGADLSVEAYLSDIGNDQFEIRSVRVGDRFRPLNAPGSKKVSDWFIDRKLPVGERRQLPIVTASTGEIVWIPGFPPAESRKLRAGMKRALRLTYEKRKTL